MQRVAFKMRLYPGNQEEYKRRHNEIWPQLSALLKDAGLSHYAIFLEPQTDELFAIFHAEDPALLDKLSEEPLMWQWWAYMADISESGPDTKPVIIPLQEVFYLP